MLIRIIEERSWEVGETSYTTLKGQYSRNSLLMTEV